MRTYVFLFLLTCVQIKRTFVLQITVKIMISACQLSSFFLKNATCLYFDFSGYGTCDAHIMVPGNR